MASRSTLHRQREHSSTRDLSLALEPSSSEMTGTAHDLRRTSLRPWLGTVASGRYGRDLGTLGGI